MVVYPLSISVKLLVDADEMEPVNSCGAAPGIVMVSVAGEGGVMLKPFCSEKEGVMTMFPDVVPVWRGTEATFPLNSAWVVFAGMVKFTVSPPLAN